MKAKNRKMNKNVNDLTSSLSSQPLSRASFATNTFIASKQGAAFEECEDAIAADARRGRWAIVDGATEAFAAGSWARSLAANWINREAFTSDNPADDFAAWLRVVGAGWHEEWDGREMSWFAATKRDAGSFAAFIGLEIEAKRIDETKSKSSASLTEESDSSLVRWRAFALGDACLFQMRANNLICALPLDDPDAFNSAPVLVPSRAERHTDALFNMRIESGEARAGDVLWLMSDALAAWFLRADVNAKSDFEMLIAREVEAETKDFLNRELAANRLRDDDLAAARIVIE